MTHRLFLTEAESEQRRADQKKKDITAALGASGTDFTALANLILDENRTYAEQAAEDAAEATKHPDHVPLAGCFRNWSPEELSRLADLYATQSTTFNRGEWFAYLGNKKKVWVVTISSGYLPQINEEGTVVQRFFEDDVTGVDLLVQAETPGHANELLIKWFEKYQWTRTKLADADEIEEFEIRQEVESAAK